MEWFFRLVMEPRRLGRRYLIGNAQFLTLALRQWIRQERTRLKRGSDETKAQVQAASGD
jgi:N-acetylglucosaminyldiphosphoundecaprenol N-acetyl-beta-D-mannosaminyltransferase